MLLSIETFKKQLNKMTVNEVEANIASLTAALSSPRYTVYAPDMKRLEESIVAAKERLTELTEVKEEVNPDVELAIEVLEAMDKTEWVFNDKRPLWYSVPSINEAINKGVAKGWLFRNSLTQVEWCDEAVEALRTLLPSRNLFQYS